MTMYIYMTWRCRAMSAWSLGIGWNYLDDFHTRSTWRRRPVILCLQPLNLTEERSDVIKPRRRVGLRIVKQLHLSLTEALKPRMKMLRITGQCRVTVVQTTEDKWRNQWLNHGSGHWYGVWNEAATAHRNKHVDTVFLPWELIYMSESRRILIEVSIPTVPTRSGACGEVDDL